MSETIEGLSLSDKFLAHFSSRIDSLSQGKTDFRILRERAISAFSKMGFPSKKHEEYRYLNLDAFLNPQSIFSSKADQTPLDSQLFNHSLILQDAYRIVLIDGVFSNTFSDLSGLPQTIEVTSLAHAIQSNNAAVLAHLGTLANVELDPFIASNTLAFSDGLFCRVSENTLLEKPIQIIHIQSNLEQTNTHTRVLFVAEKSSQCQVVQTFLSSNNVGTSLQNTVSEILVEESAHVDWTTFQAEEQSAGLINTTEAHVKHAGIFKIVTITLGADLVRNNLNIVLDSPKCEAHLYGYYHPIHNQVFDNHTLVDHRFPRCESNELYKGVIDNRATAIFNGKVYVRKDAQKTNAYQSNKNILLSDEATINTKPQLEIYADDVKCSHGSSTGILDPEQVFYLRSRGISLDKARSLLLTAYASEIVEQIPYASLRESAALLISERI
jgi:Fe-S cluster assembly protein SufD